MNIIILLFIFLLVSCKSDRTTTQNNIRSCHIIGSSMNFKAGQLSDYWAQEIIGSDLLKEELKKKSNPYQENEIAVFDTDYIFDSLPDDIEGMYRRHAVLVKNLISSEGNHSILPEMERKKIPIFLVNVYSAFYNNYIYKKYMSFSNILKEKPPAFINNSMLWIHKEQVIYDAFYNLSPYTILVTASGNSFPKKLSRMKGKASRDFDAIIVGSFSPDGFASDFSQEGGEVYILAPSDDYLITSDIDGAYKIFGGTSGATPLVMGSLAGFEWLSGYHPTAKEAKILLEKTAISTIHSHENPRRNGVGLLNSYKLGIVGKTLNQRCRGKGVLCFQQGIRDKEFYKFQPDKFFLEELSNTFPECLLKREITIKEEVSCDKKRKMFKKLRQTVLLSPKKKELWNVLSCVYKQGQFFENGKVLDSIAASVGSKDDIINILNSYIADQPTLDRRIKVALVANRIADIKGFESLKTLAEDDNPDVREKVAIAAGAIGGTEGFQILNILVGDPEAMVQRKVAKAAGEIGGAKGFEILNTLVSDLDGTVKVGVAEAAGIMGGAEGFQILNILIDDPEVVVRETVARVAGEIGGAKGFEILKTLAEDDHWVVRVATAEAAGIMGGAEGFQILNMLVEDPEVAVRATVAEAAGAIGNEDSLLILNVLVGDLEQSVQRGVAIGAGMIGGKAGFLLLKAVANNVDKYASKYILGSKAVLGIVAYELSEIGSEESIQLMYTIFQDPMFWEGHFEKYVKNSILYYLK